MEATILFMIRKPFRYGRIRFPPFPVNGGVPVISGMSCNDFRADGFGSQEQHHPTQVIADLITMIERKPQGKKLSDCTFMWLGDGADGFDCVFTPRTLVWATKSSWLVTTCS